MLDQIWQKATKYSLNHQFLMCDLLKTFKKPNIFLKILKIDNNSVMKQWASKNILNAKLKMSDWILPKQIWFLVRHLHEALYSERRAILYLEIKMSKDNISQEHLHGSIFSINAEISFELKVITEQKKIWCSFQMLFLSLKRFLNILLSIRTCI